MQPKQIYELAYTLYNGGKYDDAADMFRLLLSYNNENPAYWMGLGASRQAQKRYQEALTAYYRCTLLNGEEENPFPLIHSAECFLALNDKEKMLEFVRKAKLVAGKCKKFDNLLQLITLWETRYDKQHKLNHSSSSS